MLGSRLDMVMKVVKQIATKNFSEPEENVEVGTQRPSEPRSPKPSKVKVTQIAPAQFATALKLKGDITLSKGKPKAQPSFWEAFGVIGPPLLVTTVISIAWTTWLIVLTLSPNATANYLMDTGDYDSGQFWMIADHDSYLKALAIAGFGLVDGCYMCILSRMVIWRGSNPFSGLKRKLGKHNEGQEGSGQRNVAQVLYDRAKIHILELVGIRGRNRKFWNVWQKVLDLGMQSLLLHGMLEDGFSVELVLSYAAFLCVNALATAIIIFRGNQSSLHEILLDSFFDMVAAVLFPILVLLYSFHHFDFDYATFDINVEVLPPGSFERNGRLFSDPAERALFREGLNSLRILSLEDLGLRLTVNLFFCHRLVTVIELLLQIRDSDGLCSSRWGTLGKLLPSQRRVPRFVAVPFAIFGAAVVAYAQSAISTSLEICRAYPECAVYAFRWDTEGNCPCRTLVDVHRTPQSFEEWMNPKDVTETVKTLARAGELRNLQLINRALRRWPEQLRGCSHLEYISLIYTETEELPAWAKHFKKLEFLHIEGKELRPGLSYLPDDLFSDMPFLSLVHIGLHPALQHVPRLTGVPNLWSLTLACLFSVQELPSFDHIPKLKLLALPCMSSLRTLPDLAPLQQLDMFSLLSGCTSCCNGFMGECDLTHQFCAANPLLGKTATTCLGEDEPRATAASLAVFNRFEATTCSHSGFDAANVDDSISKERIDMCGGIRFRQCELPVGSGNVGICINNRMQVLSCVINDDFIKARKLQIQRHAGPACDPIEEAWLGCGEEASARA